MATVYRVLSIWSGFQGAPGYTKHSFMDLLTDADRNAAGAAVRAYWQAQAGYMVNGSSILVQPTVQEYDMATGVLTGEAQMSTAPTVVVGTGTANPYAAGAGYCVTWKTTVVFNGHRIQGRTFHVPSIGGFDVDGSLSSTLIGIAGTAAAALIAASGAQFAIWSRQMTKPVPPAKPVQIGGAIAPVSAYVVKDAASSLRSRRN